jgi:hypothetical protein
LSGDADTNCAIVGGLIGAYVGVHQIEKYMLETVFEFDCTNDEMLLVARTKRPDFLNVGMYGVSVIQRLLEVRVKDSVDVAFIDDEWRSRKQGGLVSFKRGGIDQRTIARDCGVRVNKGWSGNLKIDPRILERTYTTELDSEALKYIIDIGRSSKSPEEILSYVTTNYLAGGPKNAENFRKNWSKGMDYQKELSEIIFPLIDRVVAKHSHNQYKDEISV